MTEEEKDLGWGLYEKRNSKVQKTGTINKLFHDPNRVKCEYVQVC